MNILVAGAGYIGLPLAVSLKNQGHRVRGWVASENSTRAVKNAGIEVICGDLAQVDLWQQQEIAWDGIFYCPSTSGGGVEAYEKIHRQGLANALCFLPASARMIYTSSTSVYGQADGSEVDETAKTEPLAAGSRILLEAENRVLARKGTVLRLAGIYGPGRSVYLQKLREGRAGIPGDGSRWVNQIHQSDAVSALQFLWKSAAAGEIWNGSDNEPVALKDLYAWLSAETGLPLPASGAGESGGKRGLTHKKVLNGKLRQAGWRPGFPTFREGYRKLVQTDLAPKPI